MKRRLTILLSVVFSAALLAFFLTTRTRVEPVYKGKTASSWLDLFLKSRNVYARNQRPRVLDEAPAAFRQMGPKGVPFLVKALSTQESLSHKLHRALFPKLPLAIKRRFPLFPDQSAQLRLEAINILIEIGPDAKDAIPALIRSLKDREPMVRRQSAYGLGIVGQRDKRVRASLLEALKDSNPDVSTTAGNSLLLHVGVDRTAIPILISCLKDSDAGVRSQCATILGTLRAEANEALGHLLRLGNEDQDAGVRRAAARALFAIDSGQTTNTLRILVSQLKDGVPADWMAIGELGESAAPAVPILIDTLKGTNSSLQASAVLALGMIGASARGALPTLKQMLHAAEDDHYRLWLAMSILRIDGSEPESLAVAQKALTGDDDGDRLIAARTLWGIENQASRILPALLEIIQNKDGYRSFEVRKFSLELISEMGGQAREALAVVKWAATNDPEPAIQSKALQALKAIESGGTSAGSEQK